MTEPEYTAEIALSSIFYRDMVGLAPRSDDGPPLSLSLQQALYDERGLPE